MNGIGSSHHPVDPVHPGGCRTNPRPNQQPATSNQQPATSNQQPATSNQQPPPPELGPKPCSMAQLRVPETCLHAVSLMVL